MQAISQISLESIGRNYKYFLNRVAPAMVIPVVKANAYGHGAIQVTRYLNQNLAVKTFAVATLEEAQELSADFPDISILIFSRVFSGELASVPHNALLSVGSMEDALSIIESDYSGTGVHLNINTGMNRLGLSPDEAIELISNPQGLDIHGVYSHYSSSDTTSEMAYEQQKQGFRAFVVQAQARGFQGMIHLSNSAGAFHDDSNFYDAMRLGIGLYGYDTSPAQKHAGNLQPAMEVKAPLIRVARIEAGEPVSYAEKWQAAVATNIGTLRIGYADGYNRGLTNRGVVSFGEKAYPVVGTVTMDHIMIDLGDDQPDTGSMFTVIGGTSEQVKVDTVSKVLNTIPYEICCAVSNRVKRDY